MPKRDYKPYRIIGAYDSETTNLDENGVKIAFPILHQIGILDAPIETITAANVKQHKTTLPKDAVSLFCSVFCFHNILV